MIRIALWATGRVQGVGFRPSVARRARALALGGFVRNEPGGVRIEVEGPRSAVDALERAVQALEAPVEVRDLTRIELTPCGEDAFHISPSHSEGAPLWTVPPDLATCPSCIADMADAGDPRHAYPFTSCTACGPRYTIAEQLPFDRERTAMSRFPLCPACAVEYADLDDRRFHAQATVCPRCGPALDGSVAEAAELLRRGGILALKGLGGFQLLCDAQCEPAVRRLRTAKGRPDKPLAILARDVAALRRLGLAVTNEEAALLRGPSAPIVLLAPARTPDLAPSVTGPVHAVGAMLPTTGLHLLLAGGPDALVCTSGNRAGALLCRDGDEASTRLAGLCDAVLDHDRPILRPVDDSVARVVGGRTLWLRRARGVAPAALDIAPGPAVLALGAHLKSTVALAVGRSCVLSPHLGDLGHRRVQERLQDEVRWLLDLLEARPEVVACDLHPELPSTQLAHRLAGELGVPLARVQHHRAHVAAVLAEHPSEGAALGLAWDGVGYGDDGATWGGEAFCGTPGALERVASLRPFPLPGAELASRQPARAALGLALDRPGWALAEARLAGELPLELLVCAVRRGVQAPLSSSMGRLFDAVAWAAIPELPARCTWEGQAAVQLEQLAHSGLRAGVREAYPLVWEDGPVRRLDGAALLAEVLRESVPEVAAARFHLALAAAAAELAQLHAARDVVLSGGCFQNAVLLELVAEAVREVGARVLLPVHVPPGDNAIALGQVAVARARTR